MPSAGPSFDELSLHVLDLEESRTFYVDRLGFGVDYQGEDFLVLTAGGTRILLHASSQAPEPADLTLQIRVEDVDELCLALVKGGVRLSRPPAEVTHEGDSWSPRREARLRDPDGYDIALFTPLRKRNGSGGPDSLDPSVRLGPP